MQLTPVLILVVIFGAILGIVYLNIRKKERMTLIEKGYDASIFYKKKRNSLDSLRYGLLLIGLALGILIGKLLANTEAFQYEEEAAYFSMIFLFGGLALVINHFLAKKIIAEEKEPSDKVTKEE